MSKKIAPEILRFVSMLFNVIVNVIIFYYEGGGGVIGMFVYMLFMSNFTFKKLLL